MMQMQNECHPPIDNIDFEIANLATGWMPRAMVLLSDYGPLILTLLALAGALLSGMSINSCVCCVSV